MASRPSVRRRTPRISLVLAFAGLACASESRLPAFIAEPSGATTSPAHAGVLWIHGDSGTDAALFAVRERDGAVLVRLDVAGVTNVDWEDVAAEPGALWIGDIGNNTQAREDLAVHRVPEPRTLDADVTVRPDRTVRFRYPDQDERPNWDAEALFVHDDRLWLLTKHRADTRTTLYRFPTAGDDVVLERIAEFDLGGGDRRFGGQASGATPSPDGRHLAVLSYHALFIFDLDAVHPLAKLVHRIDLDMLQMQQCEAVAWTDRGLVVVNESRRVFRLADPLDATRRRFP